MYRTISVQRVTFKLSMLSVKITNTNTNIMLILECLFAKASTGFEDSLLLLQ